MNGGCQMNIPQVKCNSICYYFCEKIKVIKIFEEIHMAKLYLLIRHEKASLILVEYQRNLYMMFRYLLNYWAVKEDDFRFFEGKLDGDTWEDLCQSCYRIRYQEQHYLEVLAVHGGDAGIEGFTRTGIVNQCYCPERDYSDDELYEHLRKKMTTDIGKLLDKGYKARLKKLGVPTIHEWHFVIPEYRDSRIIEHAETKRKEVLQAKSGNPSQYDYIVDDFVIVIKVAEDFKFEITKTIRESLTDAKLNIAVREVKRY